MSLTAKNLDIAGALNQSQSIFGGFESQWRKTQDYEGVFCPGYSVEESNAADILQGVAEGLGARAYQDLAGNVHFHFEGENSKTAPIMVASHIDAVPSGGRYDGRSGVVTGLAAIKALQDNKISLPQDMVVTVCRAEESAWWQSGVFGVGAKLITKEVTPELLETKRVDTKRTLSSHMQEIGMNVDALAGALKSDQVIFPYKELGHYLETHIEQSPALLDAEKSLGIVTDIRTYLRFKSGIIFNGKSAHSGATPQHMRQDAVIAGADFISCWTKKMQSLMADNDLVFTIPDAKVIGPGDTSVPEQFLIMPEVRSLDKELLERVKGITFGIAKASATQWHCSVDFNERAIQIGNPAKMNKGAHDVLMELSAELGVDVLSMPSGAGHDAGTFANAGVPSNMIFTRHGNEGISHNPNEILGISPDANPYDSGSDFANSIRLASAFLASGNVVKKENNQPFTQILQSNNVPTRHIA